jgi:adenylate cyclase class IV
LLTALGYRSVRVISKSREVWKFTRDGFDLEACLDDAGAIGRFVELEVLAEPDRFEAAKAVVLRTAAELGLTEVERRSYLAMHLAAQES